MGELSERARFFQGFVRRPKEVGSVIPSSRFMEARIVRLVDPASTRVMVELGPGTGGTTRAVLKAMPEDGRLLAIDTNEEFVTGLADLGDPRLIAQQGTAADMEGFLEQHGLPAPEAIFSGIPFSTMPREVGVKILEDAWRLLPPGGRFMAYQFRDEVYRLARAIMGEPAREREWANIPPMYCFRWDKPEV